MLSASNPPIAVDHHTQDPDPTNWTDIAFVGDLGGKEEDGISDWTDDGGF